MPSRRDRFAGRLNGNQGFHVVSRRKLTAIGFPFQGEREWPDCWLDRLASAGPLPRRGGGQDGAKTQKASQVAASADRVETIDPGQFSPIAEPRQTSEDRDAGPWFVGKTVGGIYQVRVVRDDQTTDYRSGTSAFTTSLNR